jgi:hypothetical protein
MMNYSSLFQDAIYQGGWKGGWEAAEPPLKSQAMVFPLRLRSTERTNGRAFLPASHFKAPPPATSSLRFHFPTFFFVQPAELDRPHTLSAFKLWK